jgi:hypothetical protein
LESLRIIAPSNFASHKAFELDKTIDSWARDIHVQDGVNCVKVGPDAKRVTLERIVVSHSVPWTFTNTATPADFSIDGTQILLDKCEALGTGSWAYVTQSLNQGPIVFLNCGGTQTRGIAPHQRWTTGVLADRACFPLVEARTAGIDFRNRGSAGSGHGWSTAWSVAWNARTPSNVVCNAPGTINWSIGGTGAMLAVSGDNPIGVYDSLGTNVTPNSLYLRQLQDRISDTAIEEIGYGDLAEDGTVTASSTWSASFTANQATDATTITRWAATNASNQWLSLDFFEAKTYSKVIVKETSFPRVTSHKLQSSSDGINWIDIPSTTGGTIGPAKTIAFASQTSRYLRLLLPAASAPPTINQFEVYPPSALVSENFDRIPSLVSSGWSVNETGGYVDLTNNPSASNRCLRLSDTSTTTGVAATRSFSPRTNTVVADFRARFDWTTSKIGYIDMSYGGLRPVLMAVAGGNISYYNGQSYVPLQTYIANTWYRFKIVADPATQKCDIYIDGLLKGSQLPFAVASGYLSSFSLGSNTAHTNYSMNLDNLIIR